MALAKMQALATFLINQKLFAAEQFDYWMENGASEYSGKREGNGYVICRFRYDAVFDVERYSQDASDFLVMVSIWLMENDGKRTEQDLPMPEWDVTPLDDSTTDVQVKISFDEDITIVPDDSGKILYRGNRYSVAPAVITDASKVGVGDTQQRPTDHPYERPAN
ncbi:phage tail protein [Cellvibrio sp. UBA7671]|uniref:phage tail protein n=1 Tax=Cellvibrio sp. UBA7671 TaxID=1946312 RepID=UPI002F35E3C7